MARPPRVLLGRIGRVQSPQGGQEPVTVGSFALTQPKERLSGGVVADRFGLGTATSLRPVLGQPACLRSPSPMRLMSSQEPWSGVAAMPHSVHRRGKGQTVCPCGKFTVTAEPSRCPAPRPS